MKEIQWFLFLLALVIPVLEQEVVEAQVQRPDIEINLEIQIVDLHNREKVLKD